MPLYTFQPVHLHAPQAPAVEAELPHDLAALRHTAVVLSQHPSALRVAVTEGGRHVAHVPGPGGTDGDRVAMAAVVASRLRIRDSMDLLRKG